MKSSKETQRVARQLLKATVAEGRVDAGVVKKIVRTLSEKKPRGYLKLIDAYTRLVRMELERGQAIVESAVELDAAARGRVEKDLKKKHGDHLATEFRVNPDLLGGMRVRVGSDVWDGSVKARLQRLRERFG
ncbi:MAG: F0F1 ATP synthase subunit delta [Verrucomicrobiae bacterium]|nr:F0F1 ATP synthase subunit delta [Verrucomicrobiae bacterium]MCP5551974.1 F0F1 ATP synthase subunit delta [Akkermansiaceae bacterium]